MNRYAVVLGLLLVAAAITVTAQEGAAAVNGRWRGRVAIENSEMAVDVVVKATGTKAEGTITGPHGEFAIKDGTFADGKWTLPFTAPGMQGRMVGAVKGDRFTGDWVNPAMGTGFFELTRAK